MRAVGTFKGTKYDIPLVMIRNPDKFLSTDAAFAFIQMDAAAKAAGITLVVNTAHRDAAYQQRLYDEYLAKKLAGLSPTIVAAPGTSFHEIGEAVDISTSGQGVDSPVYKWLKANAGRFGFLDTVSSEPWHWQYAPERIKGTTVDARFTRTTPPLAPGQKAEVKGAAGLVGALAGALALGWWYVRR